jgi:hypothetical protein
MRFKPLAPCGVRATLPEFLISEQLLDFTDRVGAG